MYCKKCGKEVNDKARFCRFCGEVLANSVGVPHKFAVNKKAIFIGVLVLIGVAVVWSALSLKDKLSIDEQIAASVVNVFCVADEDIGLEEAVYQGSGTIIDSSGLILTNAHLIPEGYADEDVTCMVILPEPSTGAPQEAYYAIPYRAGIISEYYDVASLEIYDVFVDEEGIAWGEYPKEFPVFDDTHVCSEEYVRLGESVRVFGYPGVSGSKSLTVTEGVVSTILLEEGLILTSAKIDEGNSGGLAVDKNGCMLGIPSAVNIGTYENLGIIISSDLINEFISAVEALDTGLLETIVESQVESERAAKEQAEAEVAAARAAQQRAEYERQQAEAAKTLEIQNSFLDQLVSGYNAINDGIGYYNDGMDYYNSGSDYYASNLFSQAKAIFYKTYNEAETLRTRFTGLPYDYYEAAQSLASAASECTNAADEMYYTIQYDYIGSAELYSEACFTYANKVRSFLTAQGS